jgi:hypothetical protein
MGLLKRFNLVGEPAAQTCCLLPYFHGLHVWQNVYESVLVKVLAPIAGSVSQAFKDGRVTQSQSVPSPRGRLAQP